MKDFKLDDTGDLILDNTTGDLEMTSDENTLLAQQIQSLVDTNLGELFWNRDYGLNHVEIMANDDDINAIHQILDDYLRENLPNYAGITLDGSKYDRDHRKLNISGIVVMTNNQRVSVNFGGVN